MNVLPSPKACHRIQPLLDSYVSNELLVETTHDVMRHLESCADCRARLDQLTRARTTLRGAVNRIEAPPELRARVRATLDEQTSPAARPWRMHWLQPVAAAAMLFIGAVLVQITVRDPQAIAHLLNLGWEQHTKCTLAGHYPANPPAREQMVKNLGPRYVALLPAVEQKLPEYRIREAHICRAAGRQFAHLILQQGDSKVSVSLVEKNAAGAFPEGTWRTILRQANGSLHTGAYADGNTAAFQTNGHVAFIMGNATPRELERIAGLVKSTAAGL